MTNIHTLESFKKEEKLLKLGLPVSQGYHLINFNLNKNFSDLKKIKFDETTDLLFSKNGDIKAVVIYSGVTGQFQIDSDMSDFLFDSFDYTFENSQHAFDIIGYYLDKNNIVNMSYFFKNPISKYGIYFGQYNFCTITDRTHFNAYL